MAVSKYPPIQIVDQADVPIGGASMDEAHEKGLIHRIVYVLVEDSDGNILLQQRSPDVLIFPGRWDVSAGGHVDFDEDYLTAAKRELKEELGLTGFELQEVGSFYDETKIGERQLNRFCHAYKLVISPTVTIKPEPSEVAGTRWVSADELREMIANQPEKVAGGLADCAKRYYSA